MTSTQTAGGGDGRAPKKPRYEGFWHFAAEMDRLDLWPRMDDAFAGRALEGAQATELEQARRAWLDQHGQAAKGQGGKH